MAYASRRSLVLNTAASLCLASQPQNRRSHRPKRRIVALCSAPLPAHARHARDGDLPAPPRHSRVHALSPDVSVTHLSPSRRSLVLSTAAGLRIASQPGARRGRRLTHRVATLCSAYCRPSHRNPEGSARPPAHTSRRRLVLGAVAGSRVASEPCAQRGRRLMPHVAALKIGAATGSSAHPCTRRGSCSCSRRSPVPGAAAVSYIAAHPVLGTNTVVVTSSRARRGCRLRHRAAALC